MCEHKIGLRGVELEEAMERASDRDFVVRVRCVLTITSPHMKQSIDIQMDGLNIFRTICHSQSCETRRLFGPSRCWELRVKRMVRRRL